MKHVFRGAEIAHAWIHRLAPCGRVENGGVSFEGDHYLSYATCIAERRVLDGKDIYFLSLGHYSVTTTEHQNRLSSAIPGGATVFRVTAVAQGCRRLLSEDKPKVWARNEAKAMLRRAGEAKLRASRARTYAHEHLAAAVTWVQSAQNLCKLFKVRMKITEDLDALERRVKAADRKARALVKRQEAKRAAYEAERLAKWKAGDLNVYGSFRGSAYLRVRDCQAITPDGMAPRKIVETSKGVHIPYDEARLALSWLLKHRTGWRSNGETFKIAGYNVDSVSEAGVVAGCHRVHWDEIERIAKAEGWMK